MTKAKSRKKADPQRSAGPRREAKPREPSGWLGSHRTWVAGVTLFILALLLRVLFWQATPDSAWPYSSFYRGDAVNWLQYASAIQGGMPFQDGLPLRPPGMAYLVALLWDGSLGGVGLLKFLWCVFGSVVVVLFYAAVLRPFGFFIALVAGLAAACSTALMLLSTSLNNEVPYLLLVMAAFCLHDRLCRRPLSWVLVVWSVLHSLACLVRVEHVLFFALILLYYIFVWARQGRVAPEVARGRDREVESSSGTMRHREAKASMGWRQSLAAASLSVIAFILPLAPWQIHAMTSIRSFNRTERPSDEALSPEARRAEELIRGMTWDPAAVEERNKLPGFIRRLGSDFVAATVQHRGRQRVRAEDFQILEDAFGYRPEPLNGFPFVTSYGALNFYLANNRRAAGGFNRFGLDDPAPLRGGASTYYPDLLLEPPGEGMFFFDWPLHLEAFNHGYGMGWEWIRTHPGDFLGLAWKKLRIFWSGATLGFTGFNIPLGLSGLQRAVDLVVPRGGSGVVLWRLAGLILCVVGIVAGRRRVALYPWLLFFASKLVVVILFYGYARIGATVTPVIFLLGALVIESLANRWIPESWREGSSVQRDVTTMVVFVVILLLLVEGARAGLGPRVRIDGREIGARDPFPSLVHRDREIDVRFK